MKEAPVMKLKVISWCLLIAFSGLITACEDKGNPKEKNSYHVWLHNDKGQVLYSGKVKGLSSCRYVANQRIRNQTDNPGWDYTCCRIEGTEDCKEKDH